MGTFNDFQSELTQVKVKINHLKGINETLCRKRKLKSGCLSFSTIMELDKNASLLQQALKEETSVVDDCFKKCLHLIETSSQAKKRYKLQREITTNLITTKAKKCIDKNHNLPKKKILKKPPAVKTNMHQPVSINIGKPAKSYNDSVSIKFENVCMEDDIRNDLPNLQSINKKKQSHGKLNDKSTLDPISNATDSEVVYLKTVNTCSTKVHHGKFKKSNFRSSYLDKCNNMMDNQNKYYSEISGGKPNELPSLSSHLGRKQKKNVELLTEDNDSDIICLDPINILTNRKIAKSKLNTICPDLSVGDDSFKETIIPIQNWDFEVEPVDFTVPVVHESGTVGPSPKFTELLKAKKVKFRTGKWSKEEEALLCRNYNNFVSQFGINNPCLLFGIGSSLMYDKIELRNAKKFIKAKHFYIRLAKDLKYRTLECVYKKAKRIFDPLRKVEKFNDEDLLKLLQLVKRYGRKWGLISKKFCKPAFLCREQYFKYQNKLSSGSWTVEEENKLISAVNNEMNLIKKNNSNAKKIDWIKVVKLVGSRNRSQCFFKWHWDKKLNGVTNIFNKQCKAKLVHLLKTEFVVSCVVDINWDGLFQHFKTSSPSISYLKLIFSKMLREVPPEYKTSYQKSLNFLSIKYCL